MALIAKSIKGTQDMVPSEAYIYHYVEQTLRDVALSFGYLEVRTPVFEQTNLFERGVGDTTDVVQKEMYTFMDKGGNSLTLRPEGTAGAARAFLEHGLFNEPLPQKMYYFTSCYRHERPQAGRLREFHQFGVECFGTDHPAADAEVIALANRVFDILEVKNITLEINSIGCPECRKAYLAALQDYFTAHQDSLCDTCRERLTRNPMRILDCKNPVCAEIATQAPVCIDYLCDACEEHFSQVRLYLDNIGLAYRINPRIVRGLDYYTRTVFEFISNEIGAQGTVCGGGRYDGLMEELGSDQPYPSLGFGMGMERLLMLMKSQQVHVPNPVTCDIFLAYMGEEAFQCCLRIANELHEQSVYATYDLMRRSLKAQMKYADKLEAKYVIVIGEEELRTKTAILKDMENGNQQNVDLDTIGERFLTIVMNDSLRELGMPEEPSWNDGLITALRNSMKGEI